MATELSSHPSRGLVPSVEMPQMIALTESDALGATQLVETRYSAIVRKELSDNDLRLRRLEERRNVIRPFPGMREPREGDELCARVACVRRVQTEARDRASRGMRYCSRECKQSDEVVREAQIRMLLEEAERARLRACEERELARLRTVQQLAGHPLRCRGCGERRLDGRFRDPCGHALLCQQCRVFSRLSCPEGCTRTQSASLGRQASSSALEGVKGEEIARPASAPSIYLRPPVASPRPSLPPREHVLLGWRAETMSVEEFRSSRERRN
jgi:hypothetical protein